MNLTNTRPIPKTPFGHYLIAFAVIILLSCIFSYLDSVRIVDILPALFVIYGILDIAIFQPRRKKRQDDSMFDNRVLGFVDGLHLSEVVRFGCANSEMRRYVAYQLSKAHKIPDNQYLIEYKTASGWCYCSHIGLHGEHELFALLCIAQYAKEYGKADLASWCESKMEIARKDACYISY